MLKWLVGLRPQSFGDLLFLVGMAIMGAVEVLFACATIVTFGLAGRDESMGQAFLCLVYAAFTALFGRWWWGHIQLYRFQRDNT